MIPTQDRYRLNGPMDDVANNIRNEQMADAMPDPNPLIPCADCEEKHPFKEYWKPRYVDPDDADPWEENWVCDDCRDWERRAEENRAITEWDA